MGKIVCLGGACDAPILEYIYSLSGKKHPKLLYVPTAHRDMVDGDIDEVEDFKRLGCTADILFLTHGLSEEEKREKILTADIIFESGGNLLFLMDTWKKTGADKLIREAYENGAVLAGVSSGSMCWFKSGFDDCGENGEFMFVECMNLLPYCNCPHYDNAFWKAFDARIPERKENGIAIDNHAALAYDNGKMRVLRGEQNGEVYYFCCKDNKNVIRLSDDCRELNCVE